MKIVKATESDVLDLYRLQLLTFESEAEMIGSRMVPALMESEEEFKDDWKSNGSCIDGVGRGV
ncbi:MAG: hypothetical protein E7J70_05575 [Veillonella sp.]|nr:hypothetical protein [Veillonella sp.]